MTVEQAGVYKITLIENKGVSVTRSGDSITDISGTGQTIELENEQELALDFTPERGKNTRLLFQYQLNYKAFDLSKETKAIINQVKRSIYGWLAKVEFYNKDVKIILSPLRFDTGNVNNNVSNHYDLSLSNSVLGQKMVAFTPPDLTAMIVTVDASVSQSITLGLNVATGEQGLIKWGDGSETDIIYSPSDYTDYSYTYTGSEVHDIEITLNITAFRIINFSNITINGGEISQLTALTYLYLHSLPNATINGGEISQLTALTYLFLQSIPNATINGGEISQLTALTFLLLYVIPNATINGGEISQLTALTFLYLQSIPNITINGGEISQLTVLTYLYLINIPNATINGGEISQLTALTLLRLFSIPNATINGGEISQLTDLTYLRLLEIPNVTINGGEISQLTALTYLYLINIPNVTINGGEISQLTSLTYLLLSNIPNITINGGEVFNNNKAIYIINCSLSVTECDIILSRLVVEAQLSGVLDISENVGYTDTVSRDVLLSNAWLLTLPPL